MKKNNTKNIFKLLTLFALTMLITPALFALEITVNDYDPKPAEAGKYVNVWFKVENNVDKTENDITIELIPKDGFELAVGEKSIKNIGTLNYKSYTTIKYKLRIKDDAIKGANYVDIKIGEQLYKDLEIEVEEKEATEVVLEIADINSDPIKMRPDDENVKLEVTIQNLGDIQAKGVKAEIINLPEGIMFSESYSNIELLGNIDDDGTEKATFYIDINEDMKAGDYKAHLLLDYKYEEYEDEDNYILEKTTLPITISIKETPTYEITSVEYDKKTIRAGDNNVKMIITIKNVGEEKGEAVRLKIYPKSEQPIEFDVNNNFVAPVLEPGESGQTTLEFDVDQDANKQTFILDVEIKNIVNDDIVTYQRTVPLTIEDALDKKARYLTTAGIILVIIFIAGIVFKYTKNKNNKQIKTIKRK